MAGHRTPLNYDVWGVLEDSVKNTPDWCDLKKSTQDEFPVFVTGHMRRGKKRNDFFNGCNYYGPALTWASNYVMRKSHAWSIEAQKGGAPEPLLFQLDSDKVDWKVAGEYFHPNDCHHVEGDVYGIPLRRLAKLDLLEGNTDGITRSLKYITLLSNLHTKKDIKAFVYTVDLDLWFEAFAAGNELEDCDTVKYLATKLTEERIAYHV